MLEKIDRFEGTAPAIRTVRSGRPPLDLKRMNDARWILRSLRTRTDRGCYVLLRSRSVYPEVIVSSSDSLADVFSITFHPSGSVEVSGGVEDVPPDVVQAAFVVGNTDVVSCAVFAEGGGLDGIAVSAVFDELPAVKGDVNVNPLMHITGEMRRAGLSAVSVDSGGWTLYLFGDMDDLKRSLAAPVERR